MNAFSIVLCLLLAFAGTIKVHVLIENTILEESFTIVVETKLPITGVTEASTDNDSVSSGAAS